MKIYLSHSTNDDYHSSLYRPLKEAHWPHEIYYPHDVQNAGKLSKDIIAASDIVLAEVSFASTGQGIELGWADSQGIRIICFYKKDTSISSGLRHISNSFIEYTSDEDMISQLISLLSA